MDTFIYKSTGQYLGFIRNSSIFSRDGIYFGWTENNYVWGFDGQYRGNVMIINEHTYIIKNMYVIPPIPKAPRSLPALPALPAPQVNISPINLPIGLIDSF